MRNYGLLLLALGLILGAVYLVFWNSGSPAAATDDLPTSSSRNATSFEADSEGDLLRRTGVRRHYSVENKYSLEETVALFKSAPDGQKGLREMLFSQVLPFAHHIPAERWPLLIRELEKDNPPSGLWLGPVYWGELHPDDLLEFLETEEFHFNSSPWVASVVLIDRFSVSDPELAMDLYKKWDSSVAIDQTDRQSWAQMMVQSIASQNHQVATEVLSTWFRELSENERELALKVAPPDSALHEVSKH